MHRIASQLLGLGRAKIVCLLSLAVSARPKNFLGFCAPTKLNYRSSFRNAVVAGPCAATLPLVTAAATTHFHFHYSSSHCAPAARVMLAMILKLKAGGNRSMNYIQFIWLFASQSAVLGAHVIRVAYFINKYTL